MKNKNSFLFLILFLIPLVSADVIMPFSWDLMILSPIILIVEVVAFWLFATKIFKITVGFLKSVGIVFVANLITTIIGFIFLIFQLMFQLMFLPLFYGIPFLFIVIVIVEWGVFILFFRKVNKWKLLKLSFLVNLISYILLISYMILIIILINLR